jgi:hypothetical protein
MTTIKKQVETFADEAAERVVIASLLNGNKELSPDAELFFFQSHRAILRGLAALRRRGVPADIITLTQELRENGELEKAGGAFAVTQLETEFAGKSPEIVAFELSRLHELRAKREARRIGEQLFNGDYTPDEAQQALAKITDHVRDHERPLIEFRSPLQLQRFKPPPGIVMVGDCHIIKGSVFVIGGAPGVGKSRGLNALAVAGATGGDWFGLKVHRKFKTLIVQTENGEFRLSKEFAELDCDALEDYVRICPPPPYGLCFQRNEFRAQLSAAIAEFQPELVGFDPWNAAAREQDSREYLDTFDAFKSVLPLGDDAPALSIVAHTRKPKTDERASGRGLLNLLAGSYVLGSVPRTAFVMQAATDDTTDRRVVFTCCKNNDGQLGPRSAWECRNGLFVPVTDFDWAVFDAAGKTGVKAETLRELLEKGREYDKAKIVAQIMEETGLAKTRAYELVDQAKARGVLRFNSRIKTYVLA